MLVDGAPVTKAGLRLEGGEAVEVDLPGAPAPVPGLQPEAIPLSIVYEDADMLVVDKPAGMVVHPAPGHSGGTLVNAAEALLKAGAKEVSAYITHGVLSEGAAERIAQSKLNELVVTDSIAETDAVGKAKNIRRIAIAPLIGEAITRTASEQSVSSLFD